MTKPTYLTLPVRDWSEKSATSIWSDFLHDLHRVNPEVFYFERGHVNNASGGFWNLCWGWQRYNNAQHEVYLQIEEEKLCLRLNRCEPQQEQQIDGDLRYKMLDIFQAADLTHDWNIQKPNKFGIGKTAAFARIEDDYKWLKCHSDGLLDFPTTVEFLLKLTKFVEQVMRDLNAKHS